jgi:hypothetical protein
MHFQASNTKTVVRPAVIYLVIGAVFFILLGIFGFVPAGFRLCDFKAIYYPSKALVSHQDPYSSPTLLQLYKSDPENTAFKPIMLEIVTYNVNLPTLVALLTPLALLSWKVASVLWLAVVIFSFLFAAYLALDLDTSGLPRVSGVLICLIVSGSEILIQAGNSVALAICLCTVGVWCATRKKHSGLGMLCMALALVLKPQDILLIWACFLLANRGQRQWALKTLAVAAGLTLLAVTWMMSVSPHWIPELVHSLATDSLPGHVNNLADPGDPSLWGAMKVPLQTVTSLFWANEITYNIIAYAVLAIMFLAWLWGMWNAGDERSFWVGLAAAIPLTILVGYHRQHDTRLLILAVPACAMLLAERTRVGKLAVAFTTCAILASSNAVLHLMGLLSPIVGIKAHGFTGMLLYAIVGRPIPLTLLAMSIFYICLLLRHTQSSIGEPKTATNPLQAMSNAVTVNRGG